MLVAVVEELEGWSEKCALLWAEHGEREAARCLVRGGVRWRRATDWWVAPLYRERDRGGRGGAALVDGEHAAGWRSG